MKASELNKIVTKKHIVSSYQDECANYNIIGKNVYIILTPSVIDVWVIKTNLPSKSIDYAGSLGVRYLSNRLDTLVKLLDASAVPKMYDGEAVVSCDNNPSNLDTILTVFRIRKRLVLSAAARNKIIDTFNNGKK